jgi:hypothetical protein
MVQPSRRAAAWWAVATIALTAFAGYASVVGFGLGPCGGSGGVPNEAPPARDEICTILEGRSFGGLHHGRTMWPLFWMALPLVISLAGVLVAAVTHQRRWAAAGGIAAAVLVVLPWAALAVSHAVTGF